MINATGHDFLFSHSTQHTIGIIVDVHCWSDVRRNRGVTWGTKRKHYCLFERKLLLNPKGNEVTNNREEQSKGNEMFSILRQNYVLRL